MKCQAASHTFDLQVHTIRAPTGFFGNIHAQNFKVKSEFTKIKFNSEYYYLLRVKPGHTVNITLT